MGNNMQKFQNLDIADYINKINRVESMLDEIKQGLSYFEAEFQESIKRGEMNIKEGKVTICKTEEDLNRFFASI